VSAGAKPAFIVLVLGLGMLLGVLAYTFLLAGNSGPAGPLPVSVAIGGDFTLIDQNGAVRQDKDFRGRLMLVFFGYTSCPDVCPTALQTMSRALDLLGDKADAVQPVFITVDPGHDTPELLKSFALNFSPRLVALTGSEAQIAAAARAYKVFFAKAPPPASGGSAVDHSSFVYLMGRDGKYLEHFGPDVPPEAMAKTIAKSL
jgi:cytochrome oxidase Cu insertion factor (SCO1/SenC/PrrC family)